MLLRRSLPLAFAALAVTACEPSIPQRELPTTLDTAYFDPTNADATKRVIPLPNDLAYPTLAALTPTTAFEEIQKQIGQAQAWPNDTEVPITIRFRRATVDPATLAVTYAGSPIDAATVVPGAGKTLAVLELAPGSTTPAAVNVEVAGFDPATSTLTIRKAAAAGTGARTWRPGATYFVALRGGASGVKTTDAKPVAADAAMFLLVQSAAANKSLLVLENQGALPGTPEQKAAAAALLEPIRAGYAQLIGAVDAFFPKEESVMLQSFKVQGATLPVDSANGIVPLPSNFLLNPQTGKVVNNPAFGAAAAGLATLDGFSTTALWLAPFTLPVDASTINASTVYVYRRSGATWTRVRDVAAAVGAGQPATAQYVTQPPALVVPQGAACPIAGGCTTAIGLAPAVSAPVPGFGTLHLPPFAEKTTYAVLVRGGASGVKDLAGKPLGRSSAARTVLGTTFPLLAGATPTVPGMDAATAGLLTAIRAAVAPAVTQLETDTGITQADLAMAYTVTTQSVTGVSLQLAAAPYLIETGGGGAVFAVTSVASTTSPLPAPNVSGFFAITFNSVDGIDKTTGAFRPTLAADLQSAATLQPLLTSLRGLVAVPQAANVPLCPGTSGARCAKVAVIGHGISGDKSLLFALADRLAASGYIAVATDFPLHGDRAWCKADAECGAGGVCTPFTGGAGQGDATPPGACTTGAPVSAISGQFYVSGNFFRLRDANRQDVLDQSALVLAMARPPAPFPQPAVDARAAMLPAGVVIDPSAVRYEGISLGSIAGTQVLATSSRYDRGALSVGGGTFVDIGNTSPTFQPLLDGVLAGLIPGYSRAAVTPGNAAFNPAIAAAALKVLNVAKWVLDPGEALNYSNHITGSTLPNLLADPTGATPMAGKRVFGMVAKGDTVVPNPTNDLLYALMGAEAVLYQSATATNGAVAHGFLATTASAQDDAAKYLDSLLVPTSPVTLP